MMDNVVVLVEDEPPPGDGDLLGLYEGTPLTERDSWWAVGVAAGPDHDLPAARRWRCANVEEVVEEVRITVVHEIAHHFGIDDERLHELGWG